MTSSEGIGSDNPRRVGWPAHRGWIPALVALVGLPIVVAMVVAATLEWYPASDHALIELAVRDVGGHTPLVGPFSRFGWNHPGPLLFWVLAVPYRLLGSGSTALLVGAGLVNLVAVGATLVVGHRRGGWPLALGLGLGVALLTRSAGVGFVSGAAGDVFSVDPWNPSITMFAFLFLVVAAWSMALGSFRIAPAAMVAATFVAQTHVGYVPLVVVLVAWGSAMLGAGLARRRRRHPAWWSANRRAVVGWLVATGVVSALLWTPVVVEQLTVEPGNVSQMIDYFADPDEPSAGVALAAGIAARHLAPWGPWISGDEPTDVFSGGVIGGALVLAVPALVVFALGVAAAWRRSDRAVLVLQATVAVTGLAGLLAVSRASGGAFPYLFNWFRPLAMLVWLSAGWAFYRAVPDTILPRVRAVAAPVLVGAIIVVIAVNVYDATDFDPPAPELSGALEEIVPEVRGSVGDGPVYLESIGPCWSEAFTGVALALDRAGVPVLVPESMSHTFGEHRVYEGDDGVEATLTVGCRDAARPSGEHGEVIAHYTSLTPEEETRFDQAADEIRAQLTAHGNEAMLPWVTTGWIQFAEDSDVDPDLLAEYGELFERAQDRVSVFRRPGPPA